MDTKNVLIAAGMICAFKVVYDKGHSAGVKLGRELGVLEALAEVMKKVDENEAKEKNKK